MSSERLLVSGAGQHNRYTRSHIKQLSAEDRLEEVYSKAVLLEIDFAGKRILRRLEMDRETIDYPVGGYATNFTVPARNGDTLHLPSHGSIYEVHLPTLEVRGRLTNKLLNDVHHVHAKNGSLHVVSTGLDRVVELDKATGEVRDVHPVLEGVRDLDPAEDYRLRNTKPHLAHPNFVYFVDGEPWVTRAKQFDTAPLHDHLRAIPLADVMVHDGIEHDGLHYFTAVRGLVLTVDVRRGKVLGSLDLMSKRWHLLAGWCRGLHVTEEHFYVGFSVFRRTRSVENIAWLKAKLTGQNPPMPTRIEKIDRRTGRLVDSFEFDPVDLNAVFWLEPG